MRCDWGRCLRRSTSSVRDAASPSAAMGRLLAGRAVVAGASARSVLGRPPAAESEGNAVGSGSAGSRQLSTDCPRQRMAAASPMVRQRQVVRKMAVQIATEKSCGNTTVTVPVHPAFAESLRAARAAGIIGADVFTGKMLKGRVVPMNKKAWAAKFKKYAVLAGVNEPKKSCHGVRKARAEVAAYADCTESQMMAMFGGPIRRCRRITSRKRTEKLGASRLTTSPASARTAREREREQSSNFA